MNWKLCGTHIPKCRDFFFFKTFCVERKAFSCVRSPVGWCRRLLYLCQVGGQVALTGGSSWATSPPFTTICAPDADCYGLHQDLTLPSDCSWFSTSGRSEKGGRIMPSCPVTCMLQTPGPANILSSLAEKAEGTKLRVLRGQRWSCMIWVDPVSFWAESERVKTPQGAVMMEAEVGGMQPQVWGRLAASRSLKKQDSPEVFRRNQTYQHVDFSPMRFMTIRTLRVIVCCIKTLSCLFINFCRKLIGIGARKVRFEYLSSPPQPSPGAAPVDWICLLSCAPSLVF